MMNKLRKNNKGQAIAMPLEKIMNTIIVLGMILLGLAIIYFAGHTLDLW